MGDMLLTAEEADYVKKYVAHRKMCSRGWSYIRYIAMVLVVLLLCAGACSWRLFAELGERDTQILPSPLAENTITWGESERMCSVVKTETLAVSMLMFIGGFSLLVGCWMFHFTLDRWNRHIQDNILEKLVIAMPTILQERGSGCPE